MKIGLLTGGGDVPGLNAAIRAVTRRAVAEGYEVVGIKSGWLGVLERDTMPLNLETIRGILPRGGTMLGTSRTNPFKREGGPEKALDSLKAIGLDALIAIGGDDTLGVALKLSKLGAKIVAIPKTIDNDIPGTDYCIGFDTAVNIVMDALDKLHPTAESHHRVMVVEVMGRDAGWLAAVGGLAGGADVIVVPEKPMSLDDICRVLKNRHDSGKTYSIVAVAEGASIQRAGKQVIQDTEVDEFGHVKLGGVGHVLAKDIEECMGYETRVTVLGHLQRGGMPSAFDRVLATRMGVMAVELIKEGTVGVMVGYRRNRLEPVPLEEALKGSHSLDMELYGLAKYFQ
jgi:6-phosphofructokinase 1